MSQANCDSDMVVSVGPQLVVKELQRDRFVCRIDGSLTKAPQPSSSSLSSVCLHFKLILNLLHCCHHHHSLLLAIASSFQLAPPNWRPIALKRIEHGVLVLEPMFYFVSKRSDQKYKVVNFSPYRLRIATNLETRVNFGRP